MPKGKIAFLVAVHTDPEMVARLARRLLPFGGVFVHVDGKQPLAPFEAALPGGVRLLRDRIRVSWGGYTQVRATLRMMETALREMPEAEHFMLMSGQDYPIGSLDDFVAMLDSRPGHSFIKGVDALASPADRDKILNARFLDDLLPFAPKGALRHPVRFVNRLVRKIDRETRHLRERTYPFDMKPAVGSSWWVLTRPMVEYVLDFIRKNPDFTRFHRRGFAMDEQYFHTIVLNSPLAAEHAEPIQPYAGQQIPHVSNVHLIDEELAKTYALEDLDEVLNSGRWFFRKASTAVSTPLLDELDRRAGIV